MEKRLILTIAMCILVLMLWSAMLPKKAPLQSGEQLKLSQQQLSTLPEETKEQEPPVTLPSGPLTYFSLNKQEIVFVEPYGAIKAITFHDYQAHKFTLETGFVLSDKSLVFKQIKTSAQEVIFMHKDDKKEIIKQFLFHKDSYAIDLAIKVHNLSDSQIEINYPLILGVLNSKNDPDQGRYSDMVVTTGEKTLHFNGRKDMIIEHPKFVALRDRYFCNIVEPVSGNYSLRIKKINQLVSEMSLQPNNLAVDPGKTIEQKFRIYLGPQDLHTIQNVNLAWAGVINYGTFDIISQLLLKFLDLLYGIVRNWGWAIIILSIAIYLILFPLTLKQMRSMKEMQMLQPRIEELKKLYKDNPQKLQKETMELYREHKVNPLGGCLPLLLQMPIFFALYQALIRSVALKGAKFLWIKDLSQPDRLFIMPFTIPVLGNQFNILPILMTGIMFFQQKGSMASTSSEQAEQQKIMLIIFPLMFGLIFYHMPAGLVLYWFVNSVLTVSYQFRMSRTK
ncbi:MAG: membrane protein insertase YidC [Candidatus Omnitrophota bacterium]